MCTCGLEMRLREQRVEVVSDLLDQLFLPDRTYTGDFLYDIGDIEWKVGLSPHRPGSKVGCVGLDQDSVGGDKGGDLSEFTVFPCRSQARQTRYTDPHQVLFVQSLCLPRNSG